MGKILKPPQAPVRSNERNSKRDDDVPDPTDSKVKELVLRKIERAISLFPMASKGALLPTTLGPGVALSILSGFPQFEPLSDPIKSPKFRIRLQKDPFKYIPVGLSRCNAYTWINSFMQLFLFLPGISDLFSFLPRSLEALREFGDQYYTDQREGRSVSTADSEKLIRCFKKALSCQFFKHSGPVDLYEVFLAICEILGLKYEWKQIWDLSSNLSLPQVAYKKLEKKPPELLVCVRGKETHSCHVVQRQFFMPDWIGYDLDAFVEFRPDREGACEYIAYLKCEGAWYQCDDERITILRSHALSAPLSRAVMIHYKKI